ncbi:MAG: DUF445 domain-containing protein [Granulosicoccus sp.]
MLDKNLTPNLLALAILLLGLALTGPTGTVLTSVGLFALSGALTNWLAVHMLFERVPGLYGSGVIVLHFEEFKSGILRLVHEQLLHKDKIEELLGSPNDTGNDTSDGSGDGSPDRESIEAAVGNPDSTSDAPAFDLEPMLARIDLDAAFNQLVLTVTESSFGQMLAMVGGEAALQPLREPFKARMHNFLSDAARSPRIQAAVAEQISSMAGSDQFISKLDRILRARLDELTPEMVRDIMQQMIRRHLGWLVIWGGVFGGLIGLLAGLFTVYSG